MATSGKKGKKKAQTFSFQQFHSLNGSTPQPGTTQVAKKVRNRFNDSDEDESGALPQVYQLPTAPRANRIYEDDESIPHKPPFLAYIANLPFDIKEDDIYEFFIDYKIESVRLPREDGEYGRLKGFGYIQFETREDLINAISLPDPQIKNRRIRINVSNESDQQKERRNAGNRSRYEGFGGGSSENKDSTNWRRGAGDKDDDRRGGGGGGYGYGRDRDRDRTMRDGSAEAGSWRTGDRPNLEGTSPARRSGGGGGGGGGGFGRDRYNARKTNEEDTRERPKLKLEPRTLPLPEIVTQPLTPPPEDEDHDDADADVDVDGDAESKKSEERGPTIEPPKPKPTGVSAEKVFGSAKPVDTAAREKQIEERLDRERLEKLNIKEDEEEEEKEKVEEAGGDEKSPSSEKYTEKDKKNSQNATSWRKRGDGDDVKRAFEPRKYSPDRRGGQPPRRTDDRRGGGQGNRDNRDRRDYNRGGYDRDNRNIDNRDRNDRENYNRSGGGGRDRDRDRGGYSNKDNKSITTRNSGGGGVGSGADTHDYRDNRQRDEKPKQRDRDTSRPEKPVPKNQLPQGGPVLSTSNIFAMFLDSDDGLTSD